MSELDRHLSEVLVGGLRPVVVELSPYDPAWPGLFEEHRARIVGALGDLEVEHIGSTSVPGLTAKPVIDVQLVVPDLDATVAALALVGYPLRVHEPGHRMAKGRGANVHVYEAGHPEIDAHLRFRDRLRADPTARQRYEDVKRSLAGREWPDMNHYAEAKSAVIAVLLA